MIKKLIAFVRLWHHQNNPILSWWCHLWFIQNNNKPLEYEFDFSHFKIEISSQLLQIWLMAHLCYLNKCSATQFTITEFYSSIGLLKFHNDIVNRYNFPQHYFSSQKWLPSLARTYFWITKVTFNAKVQVLSICSTGKNWLNYLWQNCLILQMELTLMN